MSEFLDFFKLKKNLVSVLILGILILALPLGITLLQKQQNIKSRANVDPVVFSGNVEQRNGNWVAFAPQISLELTSPLGPSASRLVELRNSFLGLLEKRLVKIAYAQAGACQSEGAWKYECKSSTCPADSSQGVGVPWRCEGGQWVNKNPSGECTNQCQPSSNTGTAPTGGIDAGACETARQALYTASGKQASWLTASCETVKNDLCSHPDYLAGSDTRAKLCGGTTGGACTLTNFNSPDACTTCILSQRPNLAKDIKDLGSANGLSWSGCTNNQLIGKWCAPAPEGIDSGSCNSYKSAACASACGGAPNPGNCDPAALAAARSEMNKAATSNPNATSGPWDNATCDQLKAEICPNPNLFVAPNATRDALCGATNNTPAAPTCNSFLPNGLSDTGQIGTGGIKIYTTTGGRVLLNVSRTPASSTIQPSFTKTPSSASELAIEPATDGSGNYFVNIPNNSSTTNDNEYTLSANVTSGGSSVNCTPFIIRVPKQGADNTCPSSISSTQARLKINNQAWTTNGTIDLGDSVTVAGFHNNQTDTAASDVALTVVGPDGPQSHVVSVSGNYTPELPGRYTVTATVVGKNGGSCTGNASLTVNAAKVTTKSYRIAESLADLNTAAWKDYISDGMVVDYDFQSSGQKFIFVQFKDSAGNVTSLTNCPKCQARIKILGENPAVTSCALTFEGNNTVVNMTGRNFGSDKGTVKGNNADLQIKQWKNDSVQVVWPNAPTGESLDLSVVNPDGQSGQGQCSALSQIALGAKVMCRAPSSYQTTNVDLQIAGAFEGGKVVKQKVSIDQDGIVQGLSQRLEEGKQYTLSIKAPKSLRRNVVFLAAQGTTNIPDFALPVGDIFPAGSGDGKINAFDHDALVRQWNISGDATGRTADFNQDGKVNSLDWSCMRTSMMDSAKSGDDPLPVAGPIAAPKTASQSSSLNSDAGSCECDLGDVVSDECITSKTATCNGKFSCVCR